MVPLTHTWGTCVGHCCGAFTKMGLHQMGHSFATFGTSALVGSLKWIVRVLNSQGSRLWWLHHPSRFTCVLFAYISGGCHSLPWNTLANTRHALQGEISRGGLVQKHGRCDCNPELSRLLIETCLFLTSLGSSTPYALYHPPFPVTATLGGRKGGEGKCAASNFWPPSV